MSLPRFLKVPAFAAGLALLPSTPQASSPEAAVRPEFPVLTACIEAPFPGKNIANKGMAIQVGNQAAICFDTDLLRVSAGWTSPADWPSRVPQNKREMVNTFPDWAGQYLNLTGVTFNDDHGNWPTISGDQQFGTRPLPGWGANPASWTDPRPEPYGPLPPAWGRYDGFYLAGDQVTLAYTIRGAKIHEQPSSVRRDGLLGFVRTLDLQKTREAIWMYVCEVEGASGSLDQGIATLTGPRGVTRVGASGLPRGAALEVSEGRVLLRLPKGASGLFKVVLWSGTAEEAPRFPVLLEGAPALTEFRKGGPARWPQEITLSGVLSTNRAAYVVDSLPIPQNNPWKRRIRIGGFDFFADGTRAAVSTWDGDVWIISGIDDTLQNVRWKRFASGLYETLGLEIVDDVIYTSGRDQITRFVDLNQDGEADYYENFNNDITSSPGFHEFVFDLQTDRQGNFYTAKAGPVRGGGRGFGGDHFGAVTRDAGTVMKISKDGKTRSVVARGFRAPNGIGVGPRGELTTGDNEGTWVPACPINWVRPGGFYGVEETGEMKRYEERDPPLAWLHHGTFDNSGGGQVWVTSDQWGPFKGELLHMSYGQCALYLVVKQKVDGLMQGGAVRIPVQFTSSAMRARFHPRDGQLYVAGLRGWQTRASNLSGIDRVRYTGLPVYSLAGWSVTKGALELRFTQPLDPASAADVQNFSVQRWNYEVRYQEDRVVGGRIVRKENFNRLNYGGHEVHVTDPLRVGRERMEVTGARLSPDGKTLRLELADLRPAMQMLLRYDLKARDGTPVKQDLLQTIHVVPN